MRFLLTISLCACLSLARAESVLVLLRTSPLAGSQYYALDAAWSRISIGDRLEMIREPANRHDANAVRIEWQGHKLGYLPRAHNRVVAEAIDRGDRLLARVTRLTRHPDPWRRVEFEVYVEL